MRRERTTAIKQEKRTRARVREKDGTRPENQIHNLFIYFLSFIFCFVCYFFVFFVRYYGLVYRFSTQSVSFCVKTPLTLSILYSYKIHRHRRSEQERHSQANTLTHISLLINVQIQRTQVYYTFAIIIPVSSRYVLLISLIQIFFLLFLTFTFTYF